MMDPHMCCTKQKVKRGLWSPEEDDKLIKHITSHGHGCWSSVPKLAGLERCGKSCRLRWINYLRPDLKRGSFTEEEENTIIEVHRILGNRWAQIAKHLPGRTDNEVKNFWNSCIKKKLLAQGLDPNTHNLISSSSSPSSKPPTHINNTITNHHPPYLLPDKPNSNSILSTTAAVVVAAAAVNKDDTTVSSSAKMMMMMELDSTSPPKTSSIPNNNDNSPQNYYYTPTNTDAGHQHPSAAAGLLVDNCITSTTAHPYQHDDEEEEKEDCYMHNSFAVSANDFHSFSSSSTSDPSPHMINVVSPFRDVQYPCLQQLQLDFSSSLDDHHPTPALIMQISQEQQQINNHLLEQTFLRSSFNNYFQEQNDNMLINSTCDHQDQTTTSTVNNLDFAYQPFVDSAQGLFLPAQPLRDHQQLATCWDSSC